MQAFEKFLFEFILFIHLNFDFWSVLVLLYHSVYLLYSCDICCKCYIFPSSGQGSLSFMPVKTHWLLCRIQIGLCACSQWWGDLDHPNIFTSASSYNIGEAFKYEFKFSRKITFLVPSSRFVWPRTWIEKVYDARKAS